jgi:hypothetical protein
LAEYHESRHQYTESEHLARLASNIGFPEALTGLAQDRARAKPMPRGVEALLREGVDAGDLLAFNLLAELLEKRGEHAAADEIAHAAAARGYWPTAALVAHQRDLESDGAAMPALRGFTSDIRTKATTYIALSIDDAGDPYSAEELAADMAEEGNWDIFLALADNRRARGNKDGARALYEHVKDATGVAPKPGQRHELENPYSRPDEDREPFDWQDDDLSDEVVERAEQAVAAAKWLADHSHLELAEVAALEAAANNDHEGLVALGRKLLQRGDRNRAEAIALQAVNMTEPSYLYGEETWHLLSEVRNDETLLVTGLKADGSKADRTSNDTPSDQRIPT